MTLAQLAKYRKFCLLALFCTLVYGQSAPGTAIPKHKRAVVLFNGSNLSQFDTFLRGRGLNSDPEQVFKVEDGVIHVSGHEMGYIVTKQSFRRFYLRADFKWGEGTFIERAGQARDSGILYNIQGEPKVWPQSIEFQIKEGETGDFWMTDSAALTGSDGKRVEAPRRPCSQYRPYRQGTGGKCRRLPQHLGRAREAARRVEYARAGGRRQGRSSVCERQARERRHGPLSIRGQNPLPVRRRRDLLPQYPTLPTEVAEQARSMTSAHATYRY